MLKIRITVKVKDCDIKFKPEFPPGVIATEILEFPDEDGSAVKDPKFIVGLIDAEAGLIKEVIESDVQVIQ